MLPQLGFAVLTARDEADAFEIYREHKDKISLVLLDLTMPRMDGEEAYRELRRIDPEVRVVPSRGYTENDLSSRLAGKGLVGFIQKYCTAQIGG